jgi:hypothetical protein
LIYRTMLFGHRKSFGRYRVALLPLFPLPGCCNSDDGAQEPEFTAGGYYQEPKIPGGADYYVEPDDQE